MKNMTQVKLCNKCNTEKNLSEFGKYKDNRIGNTLNKVRHRNRCKTCRGEDEALRYRENPEVRGRAKKRARISRLKNAYGMTIDDYEIMFEKQNGRCKICLKSSKKILNIDHCHSTGKIRGLLCWNCNIGLGYFKDDINNLLNAIKHLKGDNY